MLTEGRRCEDAEKTVLSKPRGEALEETASDPLVRTFKVRTFKDVNTHLDPARNRNLFHRRQV